MVTITKTQPTSQQILARAFRRPTRWDSGVIRRRVARDAEQITGTSIWPSGMGFDIGPLVQVSYSDGRPVVGYVQDLATVAELEAGAVTL